MELKTLKDLERDHCGTGEIKLINTNCLRQEAIKHINDLNEHISKTFSGNKKKYTDGEIAEIIMKHCQNWIKHFFNITQEDL